MKKLLLILALMLIVMCGKSQTYQIDSIATFDHLDSLTYKTSAQELIIIIRDGTIVIRGSGHNLKARITDTLNVPPTRRYMLVSTYVIMNVSDSADERLVNVISYRNPETDEIVPLSVGMLTRKNEMTIYHIKLVLNDTRSRKPKYFDEWLKTTITE